MLSPHNIYTNTTQKIDKSSHLPTPSPSASHSHGYLVCQKKKSITLTPATKSSRLDIPLPHKPIFHFAQNSLLATIMAVLVVGVLFLAMSGVSDASWCLCRSDVSESALQKALDYACGAGADCAPIHQGGPCYEPNNVKAHCSYAANSYFQRKGQAPGSCEFNNAATVTGSDPSGGGCTYPASSGAAGTGTSTTNAPPGSTTGTIAPPGSTTGTSTGTGTGFTSPNTPTTGIIGGGFGGSGLGPSGTGINPDPNDGGFTLLQSGTANLLLVFCLWSSSLVFWWG